MIAALWGTLQAFPEVYSRVTHEFCDAITPGRTWRIGMFHRLICAYLLVTTLSLLWVDFSFNMLTAFVAFLSTNLAVALMMFGALYLNGKLPAGYRTHPVMFVGGVISAVILGIVTCISAWGLASRWLNGA